MARDYTAEELSRQSQAARDLIAEIQSDDEELSHDMIEGETGLMEAIDTALGEIDDAEIIVEGCKAKITQIKGRQDAAANRVERLRGLIEQALVVSGIPTAKRPCATLTVKDKAPAPIVTSEADIPARYWRQPDPVLDKKAINESAKAGEAIPGVTLSNGGTTLTIRRK